MRNPKDMLLYWIAERELVRRAKEAGLPKPWSQDPTFQTTYFCNVHREDDRITKWIRTTYSHFVNEPMFEYNVILARFLNWPESLATVGFVTHHDPDDILRVLEELAAKGKIWGNAYVITTHGIPMPKARYLTHLVLSDVSRAYTSLRSACRAGSCLGAYMALQSIDGIGTFLAAQIIADLKNTPGHPLYTAADKLTFVAPGPGSVRGSSWFEHGKADGVTPRTFPVAFANVRAYVDEHMPGNGIDNQDLQNCLCEYDKYMRVSQGTGKSKRNYPGA